MAESTAQQAKVIMERVDALSREVSDSTLTKAQLSTCKFGRNKQKRIVCVEQPRKKVMESVQKQYGPDKKDSRFISIVLQPASERGIGMLTYQYGDHRDTESWLYLSALGKVKRMLSGSEAEQEPVSFFGSEFSTEDMETGKIDEYHYRLLAEKNYRNRPVWVIEAIPTAAKLKKSFYSKLILWVDRERYIVLKSHSYNKQQQLFKRLQATDIEQIKQLWLARSLTMINVKSQRLSTFKMTHIALGVEVSDEFLTQRTLTDFSFREKTLEQLRRFIQ